MLSCQELVQQHASDYLDGQLPGRVKLGLSMHLLMCRHCRRFIRQFKLVNKVLRANFSPLALDAQALPLAKKLQQEHARQKIISPPL